MFGTTQIRPCNWIGGTDLNTDLISPEQDGRGVTVLVSLNKKMRVVRIGEDPRAVRVRLVEVMHKCWTDVSIDNRFCRKHYIHPS